MSSIWDQVDDSTNYIRNIEPFFKQPYENEADSAQKKTHDWLMAEMRFLQQANSSRFLRMKKNLALNKGILYKDQDTRGKTTEETENSGAKRKPQKMVMNKYRETNRTRASKLLKYKPNVMILPVNDTLADKVAADGTKNLIEHIWYEKRFDGEILPDLVENKGPMGESYLYIGWNPVLGDLHKDYKKAVAFQKSQTPPMEKVPLLDDGGKQDTNSDGDPIWVDKPVRNGDVEYRVTLANQLLFDLHPTKQWRNSEYSFEFQTWRVADARLKWPDGVKNIKGDKDAQLYDFEKMETYADESMVEMIFFFHKRTESLDKGRAIVFTKDGIVDNTEFPFSHRNLPYVRWVDIQNPGEQHAVSFFEDVKGPFGAFNNLNNMILSNEVMVGSPKWMVPAGMADVKDLGNGRTVVQYKGSIEPKLAQANPTGQGAYQLREALKNEGMELADVSRVGNGNPPQGITAAVALQYLSELEQERWNTGVLKHNEALQQTVIMTLGVCGDMYDPSDERMIRLQGQDGEWQSEYFEQANLSKDYDVRVQSASALPESKAARTESLLFMAKTFPQQVPPEQVLDMLDLAQNKKFLKEGTISTRAAEAENEMFIAGKKVAAPKEFEDQLIHWKIHIKQMREWSFKNRASQETQDLFEDHVLAHETIMTEMAAKNPAFAAKLAELESFPLFYVNEEPQEPEDGMIPPDPSDMPASMGDMASVGDGQPMPTPEQDPTQTADGQLAQESLPPLDQQEGLEQQPIEPSGQI